MAAALRRDPDMAAAPIVNSQLSMVNARSMEGPPAIADARRGDGPVLVEMVTYRYFGHSKSGSAMSNRAWQESPRQSWYAMSVRIAMAQSSPQGWRPVRTMPYRYRPERTILSGKRRVGNSGAKQLCAAAEENGKAGMVATMWRHDPAPSSCGTMIHLSHLGCQATRTPAKGLHPFANPGC
jgi:hypothetical protein